MATTVVRQLAGRTGNRGARASRRVGGRYVRRERVAERRSIHERRGSSPRAPRQRRRGTPRTQPQDLRHGAGRGPTSRLLLQPRRRRVALRSRRAVRLRTAVLQRGHPHGRAGRDSSVSQSARPSGRPAASVRRTLRTDRRTVRRRTGIVGRVSHRTLPVLRRRGERKNRLRERGARRVVAPSGNRGVPEKRGFQGEQLRRTGRGADLLLQPRRGHRVVRSKWL